MECESHSTSCYCLFLNTNLIIYRPIDSEGKATKIKVGHPIPSTAP